MTVKGCAVIFTQPRNLALSRTRCPGREAMNEAVCSLSAPISVTHGRRPLAAPRDKKEPLRTLFEEVIIAVNKSESRLHLCT